MQKITSQKIKELQRQTGRVLCVEDFEDIEALDKLASRVCGHTKGENRLLAEPFSLCGISFYPLTIAKSLWFSEKCEEWELEGTEQESLLFWVLTIPNVDGGLDRYAEGKKAKRAIRKLSRRLHCSEREMTEVYKKCVGVELGKGDGDATYGGLIECLLREYGGEPDKWLYQTPLPMIEALMNNYAARVNAEADAARGKAASGGKAVAPLASERLKALRNFRIKANDILKKWEQHGEA